jgi:phosphoglycerol transferase
MTTASRNGLASGKFAILATFGAIAAYLILRTWGTQPQIMADEWYYSKLSRLQDLKDSMLPSYLYLWLMGKSSACGVRFYDCVHLANVLFMTAGAPFVYQIARQVASRPVALGIALAATLAPLNLYTTYFMPETAYYFGFYVLSWIALTRAGWDWVRWSLALGVALGLLSLVKVHALFLLPPLVLYMLYARWTAGPGWLLPGLGSVTLAIGTAAALKFGIGYLLAGTDGLHLLGSFYQANADSANNRPLLSMLAPALVSARGHLMVLVTLVPLPLAITLYSLLRRPARGQTGKPELLQLWTLLVLGATVGVTFLFTATQVSAALPEEGLRLHMRYYSFVLPLLWLVVGAALDRTEQPLRPALRWAIAAVVACTMVFALVKLPSYSFNPVDGPDIFMFRPDGWRGRVIIVLGLATLLLWGLGNKLAMRLFLFVVLPLNLLAGLSMSHRIILHYHDETTADRAGALVLDKVPAAERKYLTIAGTDAVEMLRAQFHIDDKDSQLLLVPVNAPIGDDRVPTNQKWLLVMRNHPLPPAYQPLVRTDEFTLYRLTVQERPLGSTTFSEPSWNGIVTAAEGLSKAEPFGRWSDSKHVVLHLNTVLPAKVRVRIKASSYADNADLPFVLHIGSSSAVFRVPNNTMEERLLTLDTDGTQRTIVIDVPHPVSPQEHDHTTDIRTLGIAIGEIAIAAPES